MTKALRFRASTFAVVVVATLSVYKAVSERGSGPCVQLSGGEWSGDMEALALGDAVATPLKAGSTAMAPSKGVGDKVVASSPGRPSSVGSKQLGLPVSGQCQQILQQSSVVKALGVSVVTRAAVVFCSLFPPCGKVLLRASVLALNCARLRGGVIPGRCFSMQSSLGFVLH